MATVWTFVAERAASAFGSEYGEGDELYVVPLDPDLDRAAWVEEHAGKGGPWGWVGFATEDIEAAFRLATDADW